MNLLELLLAHIPARVFRRATTFVLGFSFGAMYAVWYELRGPIFSAWPWMQVPLF